jgi:hypothetical protein
LIVFFGGLAQRIGYGGNCAAEFLNGRIQRHRQRLDMF